MGVKFDEAVAATLGGAKSSNGDPLTREQIEKITRFLKSSESGAEQTASFEQFLRDEMDRHPPKLKSGQDYVAYSGVDSTGMNNGRNAQEYLAARSGGAGLIGDTPWGEFINGQEADDRITAMANKFQRLMENEGLTPYNGDYVGSLKDMMWNAGSTPYLEQAVGSRRPIVAFVENAPKNRGFSNFELPVLLDHPDTVVNGYPARAFGSGYDALAFASRSAAEYQALERSIAEAATRNSGREVSVADVRSNLDVAGGYNAIDGTVFGMPKASFEQLGFDEMRSAELDWSQSALDTRSARIESSARTINTAPIIESHLPTGPPVAVIEEMKIGSDVDAKPTSPLDEIDDALKPHLRKLKIHADGLPDDGASFYPANEKHLKTYADASEALSRFKAPRLLESDKPHQRLFIAAFDGTGNDVNQDPIHATNVAKIKEQLKNARDAGNKQIQVEYLEGPGTQRYFLPRLADGGLGYTYEDRIEEMYARFVTQVKEWIDIDPDADIRVLNLGFSRGGSQVAGFARLLHERGVIDPDSRIEVPDEHGKMVERYTRYLIPPGEIPQVIAPFDPVATGVPMHFDRRPPPSVVSGFGIFAMDEQRHKFKGDMIFPLGLSEDGRFLNVPVAGCHSNIGGCYTRNGLSNRSMNLMVDYINMLSDKPLLKKVYEPDDPRLTVIHRSREHQWIYKVDITIDRMTPEGQVHALKPQKTFGLFAPDVRDVNEPMSAKVREKVSFYDVKISDVPSPPALNPTVRLAEQAVALQAAEAPPMSLFSHASKGLYGAAALAAMVDAKVTADRVVSLYAMDNATGAESELIHFTARGLGGWGGAVLGASAGAAVSSPTGPGAIIGGIVGGAVGVVGGGKIAEVLDHRTIYRQEDEDGKVWVFDPQKPANGWRRSETVDELAVSGRPVENQHHVVAAGVLEAQLNRKAATAAFELMLKRPPVPSDPYALPAKSGDAFSTKESPWRRHPVSGEWTREIYEQKDTRNGGVIHVLRETEGADDARAGRLEFESQAILRENVHLAPAAMAARLELTYHDAGWSRSDALPASVISALRDDDRLIGSDGAEYRLQEDGRWERSAFFGFSQADATATMQLELDTTHHLLRGGLVAHRELLAERPQPEAPTLETSMMSMAKSEYARQGLTPSSEALSKMGRALAVDYRARGLDGPMMMQLQRDPETNVYGLDSPMGVYIRSTDGDMALRFTMTPAEATEVLATQPSVPVPEAPIPTTPMHSIGQATPEQRDAREQATREANRQGLSQGDVQQEVTLATIEVRAKRATPSPSKITEDESPAQTEAPMRGVETTSTSPVPPPPMPPSDDDERNHVTERKEALSQPVTRADQEDARQAMPASSLERRTEDEPDSPAPVRETTAASRAGEPAHARHEAAVASADRDRMVSVSSPSMGESPAPGPQEGGMGSDEVARLQAGVSAGEMTDSSPPTPWSKEGTDDAGSIKTAPLPASVVQQVKEPIGGDPDQHDSALARQEDHSDAVTAPAHARTAGGARSPGSATEDREQDRDDLDRRAVSRVEVQSAPTDVVLPPASVPEWDDEEERHARSRRSPEDPDSAQTLDRSPPETTSRSFDPRHSRHPDHAMYIEAREKIAGLYERHGIPMPDDQLERTTAAVLSDARANRMTHIETVQFTVARQLPNGDMTVAGNLIAWEGDPKQQSQMPWMKFSGTDIQTIDQRDPDRDYARFREETIKEEQALAQWKKEQEDINMNPTGPVMTMGPRSLAMADAPSDGGGDGGGG
jgi:Uncharacterized alpha/beta hydrolase domain (DUF2235)